VLGGVLARGPKLAPGPCGECLHAYRVEHAVGRAQLLARLAAPPLPAQPLPVQQVRAGKLRTMPGAAEPADCFAIVSLGGLSLAEQRACARLDPQPEVASARLGRFGQQIQGIAGHVRAPGARGGFN
jgi:hypothetical protein